MEFLFLVLCTDYAERPGILILRVILLHHLAIKTVITSKTAA